MYNDIIIENFSDPQYSGDLQNPSLELEVGNPVCGDRIRIQMNISDGKISQGVFRAWGCATSVATANIFCTSIHGHTIASIIKRSSSEIAQMLGELEPSQYHCLDILHELHQQLEQNATEKEVKSWQAQ